MTDTVLFFRNYSDSDDQFLFDFKTTYPVIAKITSKLVFSLPQPNEDDIRLFIHFVFIKLTLHIVLVSPYSDLFLKHINYVLTAFPNVRNALEELVPLVFPSENKFWAAYFKYLYTSFNYQDMYNELIKRRKETTNRISLYYINLFNFFEENKAFETQKKCNGRGGLSYFSAYYRALCNKNDLVKQGIQTFEMYNRQNIELDIMIPKNISPVMEENDRFETDINDNDRLVDVSHHFVKKYKSFLRDKLTLYIQLLYPKKLFSFTFVDSLIDIILSIYEFEQSYMTLNSILMKIINQSLFPYTELQFECFKIDFNHQIQYFYPDYYTELQKMELFPSLIFHDVLMNICLSLFKRNNYDGLFMYLLCFIKYGYPLVVNVIIATLSFCKEKPMNPLELYHFRDVFTDNFADIMNISLWLIEDNESNDINSSLIKLEQKEFKNMKEKRKNEHYYHYTYSLTFRTESSNTYKNDEFITPKQVVVLLDYLPKRFAANDYQVIYSSKKDGCSLNHMYRLIANRTPLIIIIKAENKIFGAFVNTEITIQNGYYGDNEMFLFDLSKYEKYKITGANNFLVHSTEESLSFGGGDGEPALSINQDLTGYNSLTPTFNNKLFTSSNAFKIQRIEIWSYDDIIY